MATETMHHDVHMTRNALRALQVATSIAIIGALNWGLIGFFNFNLVDAIFGGGSAEQTSVASRVIYAIVGLAGLAALFFVPARPTEESPSGMPSGRIS